MTKTAEPKPAATALRYRRRVPQGGGALLQNVLISFDALKAIIEIGTKRQLIKMHFLLGGGVFSCLSYIYIYIYHVAST